jgi:hypothetical protein
MPTPKPILFLVALLILVIPASASTYTYYDTVSSSAYGYEGFSDTDTDYGSTVHHLTGSCNISYTVTTAKPYGTPDNAYGKAGLYNVDTGAKYYFVTRQNVYNTYSGTSSITVPEGDYKLVTYVYAYEYGDDARGMSFTLHNGTIVTDSTVVVPDPNVNSSASLTFSKSVADSSDLISYSWNIDPYLTGEYSEVYTGYTGQETYQILLDVAYSENTASNGEALVIILGSSSGSGAFSTGDYWLGDNYTLTATLWHDATYYDMLYFTEPIEVSEFLDTAYVHVSEVVADDDIEDPANPDENSTNPEIPELPEVPEIPEYPDLPNATGDYETSENGSVNSTWLTGYHSSVNSAFAPVDNAVSGTLGYFMSPVVMFITYIVMITDIAVVTLEQILMMVASVSVLLSAVFSVIPDKVLMVGTYALLLDSLAVILGR